MSGLKIWSLGGLPNPRMCRFYPHGEVCVMFRVFLPAVQFVFSRFLCTTIEVRINIGQKFVLLAHAVKLIVHVAVDGTNGEASYGIHGLIEFLNTFGDIIPTWCRRITPL